MNAGLLAGITGPVTVTTFRCHAEALCDVADLLVRLPVLKLTVRRAFLAVYMVTCTVAGDEAAVRAALNEVPDGHVMVRSVKFSKPVVMTGE